MISTCNASNNMLLPTQIVLYCALVVLTFLTTYYAELPMAVSLLCLIISSSIFLSSRTLVTKINIPGLFEHIWITWSVGGLGMLLGHQLDGWLATQAMSASHHMHHHAGGSDNVLQHLFSWMTLCMLVFCMPVCSILCNKQLKNISKVKKCLLHTVSCMFMLVGMLLGALIAKQVHITHVEQAWVDFYLMLLGMVIFSSLTYSLLAIKLIQTKKYFQTNSIQLNKQIYNAHEQS